MAQITATDDMLTTDEAELSGPSRRCIATGAILPRETMLRFVVAPSGTLVPDISGKLPGRGLWVAASPENIGLAVRKDRFGQAAKQGVQVPEDLAGTVARLLHNHCLDLLGMARRAGQLVTGYDKVEAWLKSHKPGLILEAGDGAEDGRAHLRRLAPEAPVISLFSSGELASALGKPGAVVHAVIAPGQMADRILSECNRLAPFHKAPASLPTDHTLQVS